jgi:acetylornithine deacetylase/succinyl-diaminopimelate desuccinylase-like protein
VLTEGVHSGDASGVVAESFRIARTLLERVDRAETGVVRDPAFHATIPKERREQARRAARVLGKTVHARFPMLRGMKPMAAKLDDLVLARTWRPALSVTGAAGFPSIDSAGNVLRPRTTFKLSLRLPPTVDGQQATARLKRLLEADPPYNARVTFEADWGATGWNAPATAPWLARAVDEGSRAGFGREAAWIGEGGTIPFTHMLGRRFPRAQFLITGVLGPQSNAHGPNEFLHIGCAKKLSVAVAAIVAQLPA